eukprot:9486219-Pyramimonas_sp.AAC.1
MYPGPLRPLRRGAGGAGGAVVEGSGPHTGVQRDDRTGGSVQAARHAGRRDPRARAPHFAGAAGPGERGAGTGGGQAGGRGRLRARQRAHRAHRRPVWQRRPRDRRHQGTVQ